MERTTAPESVGPYRLESRLGSGGMGVVYRAYDERLGRRVAIKHVRPDRLEARDDARSRFRREASTAACLSHPAIVQLHDILETEDGDWIVMELVDGPTLADLLRQGPLAMRQSLIWGRQITEGLQQAHDCGIVHRDLKSENVMIHPSGQAKILDFGLAKRVWNAEGDASLTVEGKVLGTVHSMSPEQARGLSVDARSDLFSLGTLLYEMLSGERPFQGETPTDTLTRVCTHQPPPIEEKAPETPPDLARLLDSLLEKEPERRPQSAADVAARLREIAAAREEPGPSQDAGEAKRPAKGEGPTQGEGTAAVEETLVHSQPDAVIRTLLMTDLVGSTELVERLGDRAALRIAERHDRLARALLRDHDGQEIDKTDGFLMLFERPIDAVLYAQAYHGGLADLSRELGTGLQARAGIHLGEIFLRQNPPEEVSRGAKPIEVEGLAKPTAARLMSLADGGQTLLTRSAFDFAKRAAVGERALEGSGFRWIAHGSYLFKGVREPLDIFEVGSPELSPLKAPESTEKARRVRQGDSGSDPSPDLGSAGASRGIGSRGPRRSLIAALGLVSLVALIVALFGLESRWLPGFGGAKTDAEDPLDALTLHELYQRGQGHLETYFRSGELANAEAAFQKILERNPQSAPAYAGLSTTYRLRHQERSEKIWLEMALAHGERAVELDEYFTAGRTALGLSLTASGQWERAESELRQALVLDPMNDRATFGLGLIHEHRGEFPEAEAAYRKAIDLRPGDKWLYDGLGVFYFNQARYEEAGEMFSRSIEAAPDSVSGYRNLAGAYYLQGRRAEAATQMQRALAIQPDATIYAILGNIYFDRGLYLQSAEVFAKAVAMPAGANDFQAWANLADAYRWSPGKGEEARGAYSRAIQLLEDRVGETSPPPDLLSRLALYQAKKGEEDRASETLQELAALAPLDALSAFRSAVAHEILGRRSAALRDLREALELGYPLGDIQAEPELNELRSDLAYQKLLIELDG